MVRIAGVPLPEEKRIDIALTRIYGIGKKRGIEILEKAGVSLSKRTKELTGEEVRRLQSIVDEYKVEGRLRREVQENIKRLKAIKCYRGIRHLKNLPVRGQRTRTNARTRKGRRKTIANKKKATK